MLNSQLAVTICITSGATNGCHLQLVDQEACQCIYVGVCVCMCVVAYNSLLVKRLLKNCAATAGSVKGTVDLTLPRRLFAC